MDRAPLNVSQVCSRWRTVSLSTSRLWSRVWIGFRDAWELDRRERFPQSLTHIFDRNKAAPIEMSIHTPNLPDEATSALLETVMTDITPYLIRCFSLSLRTSHHYLPYIIWGLFAETPLLDIFSLKVTHAEATHACYRIPVVTFGDHIRSVTLSHIILHVRSTDKLLQSLSSLRLEHSFILEDDLNERPEDVLEYIEVPEAQPLEIFRKLQHLEELSIIQTAEFPFALGGGDSTVLRGLQSLYLKLDSPNALEDFVLHFETPALRKLILSTQANTSFAIDQDFHDVLQHFVKGPALLEELTLEGAEFEVADISRLLEKTPLLRCLRLAYSTVSSAMVRVLGDELEGRPLCPKLKVVDLSHTAVFARTVVSYHPFTEDALLAMVKSRYALTPMAETVLDELILSGYSGYSETTRSELEGLVPFVHDLRS